MTLSSMTGFGRTQGQFENYSWVWEIRSVNGKNLDVRMRIPPGLDAFDQYIKTNLKKLISRGSLNVSLQLQKDSDEIDVKVNEAALDKLISVAKQAAQKHDMPMPSIDNLLSIRDVVEITNKEDDEEILKKRDAKTNKVEGKTPREWIKLQLELMDLDFDKAAILRIASVANWKK